MFARRDASQRGARFALAAGAQIKHAIGRRQFCVVFRLISVAENRSR